MTDYIYQADPDAKWMHKEIDSLSRRKITALASYDTDAPDFIPPVDAPNLSGIQTTIENLLLLRNMRATFLTEITVQSGSDLDQLTSEVLDAGGVSMSGLDQEIWKWINECVETAHHATARLKRYFNVARPYQIDARIRPIFDPGHPSFPSGHATAAFAAAAAFAVVAPRDIPAPLAAMHSKARSIAHNREVAGVHTPADTVAGFRVAQHVVYELAVVSHSARLPHLQTAAARLFS